MLGGEWFYAHEWDMPELFPEHCEFNDDPTWHEFESLAYSEEYSKQPINELVATLSIIKSPE